MEKDVIVACDFDSAGAVFTFLDRFAGRGRKPFVKIGMELFYAEGPAIVREIKRRGHRIFLDLKLHDIPNTVRKTMAVLSGLDGTGIQEHVASINVEKDYDIVVQYDDRYTIRLGGTDDLAYKIQYLTSILAELSDFQAGTIDLTDAANKKATFQPAG